MASYPNELTEGEGQKVMIAIAVANQPRLLIADEPTNSDVYKRQSLNLARFQSHRQKQDLLTPF